jgi:hypothetical protein
MITLMENLFFCTISFCIVGNVEAPPNANRIVPKARKKLLKLWGLCFAGLIEFDPSKIICAKMKMQANAVVRMAPIPTALKEQEVLNEYK